MKNKFKTLGKFLLAVLGTFIIASIAHSQFVLLALGQVGVQIGFMDRLSMTVSDLVGLAPGYGSVILVALALGFLIFNAISKWVYPLPSLRYPIAGFLAIGGALLAMQPLLNVTLIAGAREPLGFLFQCLAGLMGGLIFVKLNTVKTGEQLG